MPGKRKTSPAERSATLLVVAAVAVLTFGWLVMGSPEGDPYKDTAVADTTTSSIDTPQRIEPVSQRTRPSGTSEQSASDTEEKRVVPARVSSEKLPEDAAKALGTANYLLRRAGRPLIEGEIDEDLIPEMVAELKRLRSRTREVQKKWADAASAKSEEELAPIQAALSRGEAVPHHLIRKDPRGPNSHIAWVHAKQGTVEYILSPIGEMSGYGQELTAAQNAEMFFLDSTLRLMFEEN